MLTIISRLHTFSISLGLAAIGSIAQPSFSVKTNSDFPTLGTDFGYRLGRFQPYLGVSNYSFRYNVTETYTPDTYLENSSNSAAVSVFITSLGARFDFRTEGLKPYAYANVYKLFTIVDIDGNTSEDDAQIEEILSPFGLGAGFGAEYPISTQFAVFGEYGIRALFPSYSQTSDGGGAPAQQLKTEVSVMFSALNGSAGIRFYF